MKTTLLLFLLCYFGCVALAATVMTLSPRDSILYEQLLEKVEQHCYTDVDSTFYYLKEIEHFACQQNAWEVYVDMLSWGAFTANHHKKLDLSLTYLQETEDFIQMYQEELGDAFPDAWQDNQSRLSNYYYEIGYFSKTLAYAQRIINRLLKQDSLDRHDFRQLIISHLYVGTVYKKQGNYDEAIENFLYCINYEKQRAAKENRPPSYKSTLYRLAEVYRLKGAVDLSRSHYLEALAAMLENFDEQHSSANRYRDYIISYYYGLAQLYKQQNKLDSAIFYMQESLPFHQKDSPSFMNTYHYLGEILTSKKEYKKAEIYLKQALSLKKEYLGKGKNHQIAQTYQALGNLAQQQEEWEIALKHYDLAMAYLTDKAFLDSSDSSSFSFHQLYAPKDVLAVLIEQIISLYKSTKSLQNKKTLKTALEKTMMALELMDEVRLQYDTDEDKQFLNEKSYIIFEQGIEMAYELGEEYLDMAFLLAEKSKAVVLQEAIEQTHLENETSIPKTLVLQKYQLKHQLGKLKDEREQARAENAAPEVLEQLQLQQFQVHRQYEQLLQQIKKEDTNSALATHQQTTLNITEVQQQLLKEQQSLIEYFIGKNHLYIFVITKTDVQFKRIKLDFPLERWAIHLKENILYHKNEAYREQAYQLYQQLIAPLNANLLHQDLIIIPDGVLGYIPFESLLTKKVTNSKNYNSYPYLLQKHAVSYGFSANLLHAMQQLKHDNTTKKVLAFAPSFRPLQSTMISPIAQRSALTPLSENVPETEYICQLTNGEAITNEAASLKRFLDLALSYQVLHLASHGKTKAKANDSFIAFSNMIDTTKEDYKLYVKDLYRLRLCADMVVLSACETGLGEIQQGEGILSLARGFSYAGAKSLVTTLWKIDDHATKQLMQYFYQYLKKGQPKNQALRLAKLDYIQNSMRSDAHPAYWAAFVAIGDMDSLVFSNYTQIWYWMGGFVVLMLSFGLFYVLFKKYKQ